MDVKDLLRLHEGFRPRVYPDSLGILTIGYGRNLEGQGISIDEAEFLLNNDINNCMAKLPRFIPGWDDLSDVRKAVLVSMAFMGINRLAEFVKMIEAIGHQDWDLAAHEMMDSKWARQVGYRARQLATMMRTDQWPIY